MEVSNQLLTSIFFNHIYNMSDKKSTETNIRKLTKIGKQSIGLTLPIEVVRRLGWKERQRVVIKIHRKKIIISDWKR